MIGISLSLAAVAFLISAPVVRFLIGFGARRGHMDQPGAEGHKQHTAAVPNIGGIGIFWGIALPLIAGLAVVWFAPDDFWTGKLANAVIHLEGARKQTPMAVALLLAMAVMHAMGIIDDRIRIKAMHKLAVQLIVATVLVCFFDMRVLHLLESYGPIGTVGSVLVSILWIAAITNAMNMLDNMDGLSAGVGAIIASMYLGATLLGGQWFVASLCALLLGALLGFLVFNFPPARIFMGDGGSLVAGLLLSIISIRTTYFNPADGVAPGAWYGLLMPMMVMAVPLYDFTSVCLIRLSQGRSPFVGDRNHFSHRLVRRGLSVRAAVVVIWLCAIATGLSGVMLSRLNNWQAALAAGQTLAVIMVLALLERGSGWRDR